MVSKASCEGRCCLMRGAPILQPALMFHRICPCSPVYRLHDEWSHPAVAVGVPLRKQTRRDVTATTAVPTAAAAPVTAKGQEAESHSHAGHLKVPLQDESNMQLSAPPCTHTQALLNPLQTPTRVHGLQTSLYTYIRTALLSLHQCHPSTRLTLRPVAVGNTCLPSMPPHQHSTLIQPG